eukprot:425082-Rhodomonas_salina.1
MSTESGFDTCTSISGIPITANDSAMDADVHPTNMAPMDLGDKRYTDTSADRGHFVNLFL